MKNGKSAQPFPEPPVLPESETDEEKMLRVGQGDLKAFRSLYERYKRPIMSYAFSIVRSKPVAEEVAQEVFLRVFRTRENYAVHARFSTWLWTIARNCALDHARRKAQTMEVTLYPSDIEEPLIPMNEQNDYTVTPEAERLVVEKATREAIYSCLDNLTTTQREAVGLRTFSDLSYEEVATAMTLSIPSVKSLLFRAKTGLLACLKGRGYGR